MAGFQAASKTEWLSSGFSAAERCEAVRNKTSKGRGNQYAAAHLWSRILRGRKIKGRRVATRRPLIWVDIA